MVVGERILHSIDQRRTSQDLLAHLVHGSLHTSAVVLGKGLQSNVAGRLPSGIEAGGVGLDSRHAVEAAPLPVSSNVSAENTVPGLLESSELVTQEAPELGAGALQDGQTVDRGVDVNALALDHVNLGVAGLGAVLDKGVRVGLAIDVHAHPAVGDNVDVGGMDVAVLLDEVVTEDGAEDLRSSHGVLLRGDVDGVLNGVGRDHDAVIGASVAAERGMLAF